MPYLVTKGEPACLSRDFHTLRQKTIRKKIRTVEGIWERDFQMIDVEEFDPIYNTYSDKGKFWADVITGTLYDPETGQCLTSTQMEMLV